MPDIIELIEVRGNSRQVARSYSVKVEEQLLIMQEHGHDGAWFAIELDELRDMLRSLDMKLPGGFRF